MVQKHRFPTKLKRCDHIYLPYDIYIEIKRIYPLADK